VAGVRKPQQKPKRRPWSSDVRIRHHRSSSSSGSNRNPWLSTTLPFCMIGTYIRSARQGLDQPFPKDRRPPSGWARNGERGIGPQDMWSLVHRDKPRRMTQTCSPRPLPAHPLTVALHKTLTVPRRQVAPAGQLVIEFYDLLSVCCFRPPLLGSSYSPCDSNTPRPPRVPHRSGSLRQSRASAARAKPEPSADLGSARANRHW
jgi:hypothetical protein